jgi:hypothetical protein
MRRSINKIIIFILLTVILSCTDKEGATKTLERNGYKPIEVGGYGWLSSSESDTYVTEFKAIALNGDTVTGCVTRGLFFKGNTIRINN